jgi:Co/Zn/Cd efflux system component
MRSLSWVLLTLVGMLFIYEAVDRWREPQQLLAVRDTLARVDTAL